MSPVSRDDFDSKGVEPTGRPKGTVKPAIMKYLFEHEDEAFTVAEIHEATGLAKPTINQAVNKMVERGLVEKKAVDAHIHYLWIGGEPGEDDDSEEDE